MLSCIRLSKCKVSILYRVDLGTEIVQGESESFALNFNWKQLINVLRKSDNAGAYEHVRKQIYKTVTKFYHDAQIYDRNDFGPEHMILEVKCLRRNYLLYYSENYLSTRHGILLLSHTNVKRHRRHRRLLS